MSYDEPHRSASFALRAILRHLAENGITYSSISSQTDQEHDWNSNAIKQLVHRSSLIRKSHKIKNLTEVAVNIAEGLSEADCSYFNREKLIESAQFFVSNKSQDSHLDLSQCSRVIGQRFQSIRRASANFEFPARQAFVRFDWEGKRLITVLVSAQRGDDGYVFTMKITGRSGNRRVVVGDIQSTIRNTYFSGLAYEVNSDIAHRDFLEFNAFDLDVVRKGIAAPNEIGLECLTISNQFLHLRSLPVSFHGLDGLGNPTSGIGALIRPSLFEYYEISEDTFSAVECSNQNQKLHRLMIEFKAITASPSKSNTTITR